MGNDLNIHLYFSHIENESRIFKITSTLSNNRIFDKIHIIGVGRETLPENELYNENIIIRRFLKNKTSNIISKLFSMIKWGILIIKRYKKEKITCVNCHSLAVLWVGVILKKVSKTILIYDTHELETEKNNYAPIQKIFAKIMEKALMKYVDHVFVVSDMINKVYQKRYPQKEITTIFNAPKYAVVKSTNYFRNKFGIKSDTVIFIYQGMFGAGRGIDLMLSYFKNIGSKHAIIFMGYGILEEKIKLASKQYKNIYYHPPVKPDFVLNFTASADVGLSIIEGTCLSYSYCLPNKLFEYIISGLPVIVSNMVEMANFVKINEVGCIMGNADIQSFDQTVNTLLAYGLDKFRENAFKTAKSCCWDNQIEKLISVYNKILSV